MNANLANLIKFAIDKYPEETSIASLMPSLLDMARDNDKRPAWIKVAISDEAVKNINGKDKLRDAFLLVKIDRFVVDRFKSPVILEREA